VSFTLKADAITKDARFLESMTKPTEYDVIENTLVVSSKSCALQKDAQAIIYSAGKKNPISPNYSNSLRNVYLIDLREVLPDSVQTCSGTVAFNFKGAIPSGTDYEYYSDLLNIKFKNGSLYDTLYAPIHSEISEKGYENFTVGTSTTPLHGMISINLNPTVSYPNQTKTAAYHLEGNRFEFLGGEWINGRIQFDTHELGQFRLLTDSTAPTIRRISCTQKTARFRVSDSLSGIAKFEATINGEWLLMKYDYKSGILQSEKSDQKKLLAGDFQLKVTDRAGNEKTYTQTIQ
jgi:hypothetical protein